MKLVYIAHPFQGKKKNVRKVEKVITPLLQKYPDITVYSPLHATGFYYHLFPYEQGIQHCFEALRRCDELWLCKGWEESRGCNLEMRYAKRHRIPVYVIKDDGDVEKYNG